MNYQAAYTLSVEDMAKQQAAQQHAINPLWPRYAPSRGPWSGRLTTPHGVAVTPPKTAPFRPPVAVVERLGQVDAVAAGVGIAMMVASIAIPFAIGYWAGKRAKRA